MIARRHVFHVAGYDPIDVPSQHRRFVRELATFASTWNVAASASELQRAADAPAGCWTVTTRGPDWEVETTVEPLAWDDLILVDLARPDTHTLADAAITFADMVASGTMFRYFAAFWRFGLFFLAPFLAVALFVGVALLVGRAITEAVAPGGLRGVLLTLAIGLCVFALLWRWLARFWRVKHMLGLWIFARAYTRGRRADIEARLDEFAERVLACARRAAVDEIILVGHSIGANFVVDILARALRRDPDLGRHGPAICALTVGATIPKVALHPAGERQRAATQALAAEPSIAWAEYQARDDIISFYKFDPVALRRITEEGGAGKPLIRRVQIHDMLKSPTFWRRRARFMRLHYQFVMANERRGTYDYFMMVCGPVPFARIIAEPRGPVDAIAADGSYIAPTQTKVPPVMPGVR